MTKTPQLPATIDQAKRATSLHAVHIVPALVAAAGDRASRRFLEFFAANIRNPHTRRAYGRAAAEFLAWCDDQGVPSVTAVQPLHVGACIKATVPSKRRGGLARIPTDVEVLGPRQFNHRDGAGSGGYF